MRKLFILIPLILFGCGDNRLSESLEVLSLAHSDADLSYALLGGSVNHGLIWYDSADAYWREVGSGTLDGQNINGNNSNYVGADGTSHQVDNGSFRISTTSVTGSPVDLMAMLHIRSGTGGCHSRLYNKIRIVRVLPTRSENIGIDSEALIEMSNGCLRYFDASRTVIARDATPVVGQQNVYAVEIVAGDGVWTEISFGSSFMVMK